MGLLWQLLDVHLLLSRLLLVVDDEDGIVALLVRLPHCLIRKSLLAPGLTVVLGDVDDACVLGLGVSPPTPSWGSILNDGYSYLRNSPWPIIAGGVPLILVTLGFTFFGEAVRDILDPKLRGKGAKTS